MNLLEDFRDRKSVLRGVNYQDATGRLVALLEWLESEVLIKQIIDELKQSVNITEIFVNDGRRERPKTDTREEIAAVGLHLIEVCRDHKKAFYSLCLHFGIGPNFQTRSAQDYSDAGLENFVLPFLLHIERGLSQRAHAFKIQVVVEGRFSQLLGADVRKYFPKTSNGIERISSEFLRPEEQVMWQNVGNSCRQVLIDFASEVRDACGVDLKADVKEGDFKAALRDVLTEICPSERFRRTLTDLLDAVWNHTQALVHRPTATNREALQTYLWTGMLFSEIAEVVRSYNSDYRRPLTNHDERPN